MNATPEATVTITRYTVSVLPADDINHKHYALYVELTRSGWIVHDQHGGYDIDGDWAPGLAVTHKFADYEDALDLARRLAPNVCVNGRTATQVLARREEAQPVTAAYCTGDRCKDCTPDEECCEATCGCCPRVDEHGNCFLYPGSEEDSKYCDQHGEGSLFDRSPADVHPAPAKETP